MRQFFTICYSLVYGVMLSADAVFANEIAVQSDIIPTQSIIDVLSANGSYSTLLNLLQRSDLIDYVNELGNVTFLAPVNSAFEEYQLPISTKLTRDQINRFIINEPLIRKYIKGLEIVSTLNLNGSPYIKYFDIHVLVDHRMTPNNEDIYKIENANVISEDIYLPTFNSVVLGIDQLLLDPKESVCDYFENSLNRDMGKEQFKMFSSFLVSDSTCRSLKMTNMTFIAPSDKSLNYNRVERKYLTNVRGLKDKELLISNFLIDGMFGGNLANQSVVVQNWNHQLVAFSSAHQGDEIILNDKVHAETSNYILSDGIVHYFEQQIFDYTSESFPAFTPRKYLIGLDYEEFVDEVDFSKLSSLIDDTSLEHTIFVSNEYKIMTNLQNQILYHFIKGNNEVNLTEKFPAKLLNSEFCLSGTEFCQKIKLQYSEKDGNKLILNSNSEILNAEPYRVGNVSIFILNDEITLPPKLQVAIASELTAHGKSITFFKKFGFLKDLSKGNSISTIFFPSSNLWNNLDLVLDYFTSNDHLLKQVVENLIIEDVIYHDFEGSQKFLTKSKKEVQITKVDDLTLLVDNKTTVSVSFDDQILFSNGVVHPISDELPLPKGIHITMSDLLYAQESNEFMKIIEKLNLTSLFDSTKGYSVILPPSNTLLQENITNLIHDVNFLEEFVKLHILPPGSLDMILDCYSTDPNMASNFTTEIPTMLNNTHLTCRQLASGNMMLSLTEGTNNEVRILRRGIAIDQHDFNSGIFLLDRPLNPRWLDKNKSKLYLHLPLVAIFVGILIGIVFFILIFGCCLLLTVGRKKQIDEAVDRRPLLNNNLQQQYTEDTNNGDATPLSSAGRDAGNHPSSKTKGGKTLGRNGQVHSITFESKYSANSSILPIDVNFGQV